MKIQTLLLVLLVFISSCTVKLKTLSENPDKYEGKTVKIKGRVTNSTNLGIIKSYRVKDKTGQIRVLAKGNVPLEGDKVKVKGKLEQKFKFGNKHIVIFREQ